MINFIKLLKKKSLEIEQFDTVKINWLKKRFKG